MDAESLSDSELIGAYASQGLLIGAPGDPHGTAKIDSPFMQQHVRGLRAIAELALARLAPVKPIAVVHPSILNYHVSIARLEEAGYVVVEATVPREHVVVHNAPTPRVEEPKKGWQLGDKLHRQLFSEPLPPLERGLRWKQETDTDTFTVVKDLAPIAG